MSIEFDWNDAKEDGLIVVRPQAAVAVYTNSDNDAVIRKAGDFCTDECFIVIPRDKITLVASALQALLGEG